MKIKTDIQDVKWLLAGVHVILVIILTAMLIRMSAVEKHIDQKIDHLEKTFNELIMQRNELDAAYKEHLNECAFVSRHDVKMDKRGYFFSSYQRSLN